MGMVYTLQEFETFKVKESLSDDLRYEQVGNLIYLMAVPSRIHEAIVQQIQKQMGIYFDALDSSCMVYGSNSGLDLSERVDFLKQFDEFLEYFVEKDSKKFSLLPDIQVICDNREELWSVDGYKGIPSIAIEVISPGSGDRDRYFKKLVYERVGIPEYWIIQDMGNVFVYTLLNGKYSHKRYSLDIDLFSKDISEKDVLEVFSKIYPDLVIKLDKKYLYK